MKIIKYFWMMVFLAVSGVQANQQNPIKLQTGEVGDYLVVRLTSLAKTRQLEILRKERY